MVQTIVEPFSVDIIKVTIKDKPIVITPKNEESVRIVFDALRQYAQQEKKIRVVRARMKERILRRKLRNYFDAWRDYSKIIQKTVENEVSETKTLSEKKIEMFVKAIKEKQKQAEEQKKEKAHKASSETKSPPQQSNKIEVNKQKRPTVGNKIVKGCPEAPTHNRLEAQRLIIEEQRAKLAEQNKLIQEIQLNEINKEAKQTSLQTIKAAKEVLNQCDQITKRSLIHFMKEQGCRDKSIIDVPPVPGSPGFLLRIEARAEARKQRMKQAEEIRQRRREEQKKKLEVSRQEAEEKERLEALEAIKEAAKLRKEQEERRMKELLKSKKQEFRVNQFYKRYLFRRYILRPLSYLVEETNRQLEWANQHYEQTLLMRVFTAWKSDWLEQQDAKLELARKFDRHTLLWYAFTDWRSFALEMKQKNQVALDFYDMRLQAKCLKHWHTYCVKIKILMHDKEVRAVKHYERYLKATCFGIWKRYMLIVNDLEERDRRREEWRKLIRKFIDRSTKEKCMSYKYLG